MKKDAGRAAEVMTERDDARVRKALQGADFPAARNDLVAYATDRDVDEKTLTALAALPDGTYGSLDEVVEAVPHRPGSVADR